MKRRLSELEGVVLGIVSKKQPCTAYAVRLELRQAPSSHWRASAGSIYPLLARLEVEGLVEAVQDESDGRGRRHLGITPGGRRMLKEWVSTSSEPDLVASVFDPVRSRVFFLDALTPEERTELASRTLATLRTFLAVTREHLASRSVEEDPFEYFGALGAVRSAEARVEWLEAVLEWLEGKEPT